MGWAHLQSVFPTGLKRVCTLGKVTTATRLSWQQCGSLQTPCGVHCVLQWLNVDRITAATCLCYCYFVSCVCFISIHMCDQSFNSCSAVTEAQHSYSTTLQPFTYFPWTTSLKAYFERLQKPWGGASGALQTGKSEQYWPFQTEQFSGDTGEERGWGGSMSTDQEPTYTVKLLQLLLLSTYWGMQIWVTFISSWYQTHTHSNTHWCTEEVRNVGKVWRGKDREGLGALRGGWMCLGGLFPGYMHNTIITEVLFQCGCSHLCSMYIDLYTHDWIGQNALLCRL